MQVIYRIKFRFVFVMLIVEREMGLEPTTAALEGRCSTAELLPLIYNRYTVYQLPRIQSIIFTGLGIAKIVRMILECG